jgi:hypothetical protein
MEVNIGKRNCVVCIMDSDGSIIEETKYVKIVNQL